MHLMFAIAAAMPTTQGLDSLGTDRARSDVAFDQTSSSQSTEIVRGEREPLFGAAVALVFPMQGTFCSASMITPRVALTAAHCVTGSLSPDLVTQFGNVHWGPDASNPQQTAKILSVVPHPQYVFQGNNIQNDIAIIEIEPVAYTDTVWINELPLDEANEGEEFVAVGFGITGQPNSSGRKRSAEIIYQETSNDFMISDTADNPGNGGICSGDSGGPMYGIQADGRYRQYGVHSWGLSSDCSGISASTSTAQFVPFILNQVERIHDSADTCESRGANDDVYCDADCPDDVICALQEAHGGKACQTGSSGAPGLLALGLLSLAGRRR